MQHIILGTHYLDHNGTLHIQTSAASHASRVRFKEPFLAFSNKQVHQVPPTSYHSPLSHHTVTKTDESPYVTRHITIKTIATMIYMMYSCSM